MTPLRLQAHPPSSPPPHPCALPCPADGVERMHRVTPTDTWKTQRAVELGVNIRGLHFFHGRSVSGSVAGWNGGAAPGAGAAAEPPQGSCWGGCVAYGGWQQRCPPVGHSTAQHLHAPPPLDPSFNNPCSFWSCVLMEDLEAFGAEGRCLQLTYRAHINVQADRCGLRGPAPCLPPFRSLAAACRPPSSCSEHALPSPNSMSGAFCAAAVRLELKKDCACATRCWCRERQNALATYHYRSDEAMDVYTELQEAVEAAQEAVRSCTAMLCTAVRCAGRPLLWARLACR